MNLRKAKWLVLSGCLFSFFAHGVELDLSSRLAGLAEVWGFLKYYHPQVAQGPIKGHIDWDEELLAIIPDVKAAEDFAGFNAAIDRLIERAGGVRFINANVSDLNNQKLDANFQWMENEGLLDWYNRLRLKMLKFSAHPDNNFYVSSTDAGNTVYENEKRYSSPQFPEEGYRLLGLFRYWNAIHYFYPYKGIIGSDWEGLLVEFIPRFIVVATERDYHLLVREFTARINDGHSFCISTVLTDFFGGYYPPFQARCIEDRTVVTEVFTGLPGVAGSIRVGDVIIKLNGIDLKQRRRELRPYVGASNEPTAERNIHDLLFKGKNESFILTLLRGEQETEVALNRFSYESVRSEMAKSHSERWKILPGNIGYVDMGALQTGDVYATMKALGNTRAIVFDVRNYPNGTMYSISAYLNPERCPFSMFTQPDLGNPGSFNWSALFFTGPQTPNPNCYAGRVILLFDERTQSHAEFTCMSLQTAPRATLVGSQTAGADGDVSSLYLPGNILVYFTGIGVFYPDGRPTQRIGIVPDIEVRPTIQGILQGRDEVLEAAIAFIDKE